MEMIAKKHGFLLRYVQELPEIGATLYRMEYEKNGADLIWLDRPDDNKTFSITFKTIPQDDTGVFHILEHSVLNGSEKYPVKEPFVELLKSSLQTFLNAMTFPDKTMYPVSSRNDQDFLNLMDVYMDAVLHPLSISDPHAFRQEGWHYELEEQDGQLVRNGVVYSEMKGAYADPDATLGFELGRALFPDNCYGYESGGYPESIPTLTYDNYLACHKRFYHPSNARIFLDGMVDMEAALAKLDGFLQEYDRLEVDADIPMQQPVHPAQRVAQYEIGQEEEAEDKVLLAGGWVIGTFAEKEKSIAGLMLSEILAGSNEAPLKKALLDQDLCEDMELHMQTELQQPYMELCVRNTSEQKAEQVWVTIRQVLEQQAEKGLDKNQLHAVLNNLEFSTREQDYGSAPKGLIFAMLSQEAWLYGGDPAQGLCFDETFRSLRSKIDTDWYENFLRTSLLENPHTAQVMLLPSKTLGQERKARELAELEATKAAWSKEACEEVIATFRKLRERQNTPDTPEHLDTLPKLALSDLPQEIAPIAEAKVQTVNGTTVLWEDLNTNGITYLALHFSLADIPQEQLSAVCFLTRLVSHLGTEQYSSLELHSQIQSNLGRLYASVSAYSRGEPEDCTPYLVVTVAALDGKRSEICRLLKEILLHTDWSDEELISVILRQGRLGMEQEISMSGNAFAMRRIEASFTAQGVVSECLDGIDMLRWLQKTDKAMEEQGAAICHQMSALAEQIFTKARLTVNLTGAWDEAWLNDLVQLLPEGEMGQQVTYVCKPVAREGFQIPAEVGFAARAANLHAVGSSYTGAARVASQYLTYDFLWNAVRVKGGAYGVKLSVTNSGATRFASYRDPNARQTLDTFTQSGAVLKALADSGESIDKYIISSVGELQPIMTPRTEGYVAAASYFTGKGNATRQQQYSQILATTPEQLRDFGEVLDRICAASGICVIAGKDALQTCSDCLDSIEVIQ